MGRGAGAAFCEHGEHGLERPARAPGVPAAALPRARFHRRPAGRTLQRAGGRTLRAPVGSRCAGQGSDGDAAAASSIGRTARPNRRSCTTSAASKWSTARPPCNMPTPTWRARTASRSPATVGRGPIVLPSSPTRSESQLAELGPTQIEGLAPAKIVRWTTGDQPEGRGRRRAARGGILAATRVAGAGLRGGGDVVGGLVQSVEVNANEKRKTPRQRRSSKR